ncbi:MAG: TM2 domain-containing protein [Bacilli bacterium]|nr:TM2 domain-containing protein [Bacilli bacterium]MBP3635540.1 TM2 domain-containing protein [Bacilli bacterium]
MAKFCQKCGTELKDDDTFCSNCGNGTSQNTEVVNNTNNINNPKSKIAAGLLGIFLGAFGVHNFYLGYTGKAVGQLLITVLTCGLLSFVSAIWGLIEGILILTGSINTDAQGNRLVD